MRLLRLSACGASSSACPGSRIQISFLDPYARTILHRPCRLHLNVLLCFGIGIDASTSRSKRSPKAERKKVGCAADIEAPSDDLPHRVNWHVRRKTVHDGLQQLIALEVWPRLGQGEQLQHDTAHSPHVCFFVHDHLKVFVGVSP